MKTIEFPTGEQFAKRFGQFGLVIMTTLTLASCTAPKPVDSNAAKLANPVPTTEQINIAPKIPAGITPEQMPQIKTPEARIVAQRLNQKLAQKTTDGRNEEVVENDLGAQELTNINPVTDKIILFTSSRGDNRIIILRADSADKLTINLGQQNQILIPNGAGTSSSLGNTDSTSAIANNPKLLSLTYDILMTQPNGVVPIDVSECAVSNLQVLATKLNKWGINVVNNKGAVLSAEDTKVKLPEQSTSKEVNLTYNLNTLNPETDIVLNLKYIGKKIIIQNYVVLLRIEKDGKVTIHDTNLESIRLEGTGNDALKIAEQQGINFLDIRSEEELIKFVKRNNAKPIN